MAEEAGPKTTASVAAWAQRYGADGGWRRRVSPFFAATRLSWGPVCPHWPEQVSCVTVERFEADLDVAPVPGACRPVCGWEWRMCSGRGESGILITWPVGV